MKKILLTVMAVLSIYLTGMSQSIGIGTATPDASSQLEIRSTAKGILIPRMSTSAITGISNPAKGLMVYDSSRNQLVVNMGTPGAPSWQNIIANSGWGLNGNGGTNPVSNFIGTSDPVPLTIRTNNIPSGYIDSASLSTAFGYGTMSIASPADAENSAFGHKALAGISFGHFNTGIGSYALTSNTTGNGNCAFGQSSMKTNTTGSENTAVGASALFFNTTALSNTAVGYGAMFNNTTGQENTGLGHLAMAENSGSLGSYNTAVGYSALFNTTNSQFNTCIGHAAGAAFDMGYNNTIVGAESDINATGLFNCVAIGKSVTCTGSSQARIGNSSTVSIGGFANWTNFSDGRFKKNIQENVRGLDFIMQLRPVTYQLDITGINSKLFAGRSIETNDHTRMALATKEQKVFTGFVAQEVEAAAKQIGFDFSGVDAPQNENDYYGLRYGDFVVPLVKAVQEQQVLLQQKQQMIDVLQKRLDALEAQMKQLTPAKTITN